MTIVLALQAFAYLERMLTSVSAHLQLKYSLDRKTMGKPISQHQGVLWRAMRGAGCGESRDSDISEDDLLEDSENETPSYFPHVRSASHCVYARGYGHGHRSGAFAYVQGEPASGLGDTASVPVPVPGLPQ